MGNIRSVSKALERVAPQAEVLVTSDPGTIRAAERVVVPGQGAMPDCMRQLAASGARGEVGDTRGLGLLEGGVPRFPDAKSQAEMTGLKIPHMGWNEVRQARPHPL